MTPFVLTEEFVVRGCLQMLNYRQKIVCLNQRLSMYTTTVQIKSVFIVTLCYLKVTILLSKDCGFQF